MPMNGFPAPHSKPAVTVVTLWISSRELAQSQYPPITDGVPRGAVAIGRGSVKREFDAMPTVVR
jgi:hypothetical protein